MHLNFCDVPFGSIMWLITTTILWQIYVGLMDLLIIQCGLYYVDKRSGGLLLYHPMANICWTYGFTDYSMWIILCG
jgi:hypothetical protein